MTTQVSRSKKRTKTFTGCWTCRERKVKCDETDPFCLQCRRKGVSCKGYDTRLQWLTPIVPDASGLNVGFDEDERVPPSSLRRIVPAGTCGFLKARVHV